MILKLAYRAMTIVVVVGLIVWMLPREKKFNYEFSLGNPWRYGLLTAEFDFPIYKGSKRLQAEQDSVMRAFCPYYVIDAGVGEEFARAFDDSCMTSLSSLAAAPRTREAIASGLRAVYANGIVEQCANLGAVNVGNSTAGGIVGIVASTGVKITDCYNTADILTGTLLQTGGIVGFVGDAKGADVDVTISNCYNAGYIGTDEEYHPQQNNSIVGFVMTPAKATLNNCFNDIDVCDVTMINESGSPTINNCRNLTTDEMTAEAFVEELNGYSGEGVWSSDVTGINFGYPVLAYQAQVQEYTFDYTVTGSELGEVTVTDESGASVESGATLAEGSVVTLSATYPDDVDLTVTINGEDEDIEGDVVVEDGTCTYTKEITVDGDIDLSIVLKESGSGLAQTAGDDITVTAVDGTIVVMAADGTDVTVWTAAGAQAYAGDAAALAGQTFEAGVYIVRAGGTTHKVIVK